MEKTELTLEDVKKTIVAEDKKCKDITATFGDMEFLGDEGIKIKKSLYKLNAYSLSNLLYKLQIQRKTLDKFSESFQQKMINERLKQLGTDGCIARVKNDRLRVLVSPNYVKSDNIDIVNQLSTVDLIDEYFVKRFNLDDFSMKIDLVKNNGRRSIGMMTDGKLDEFEHGFSASNSEVGLYSLDLSSFLYRLICTNGAVAKDSIFSINQRHYGRNAQINIQDRFNLLKESSAKLFDKLGSLKDSPIENADNDFFESFFKELRKKNKSFYASKELREKVTNNYNIESQLTENNYYTLFNAITRTARDEQNVDKKFELESLAGTFLS